jgi:hypothetical protein
VSLTTRNALNPEPQLGNLWATEFLKHERRELPQINSLEESVRRKSGRTTRAGNIQARTLETREDAAPKITSSITLSATRQ